MDETPAEGHLPGLRRGDRRQAERPLPAGGVADRQRHPVQHERQRSHRQPRQRDLAGEKLLHPNDHVNMSPSLPTTPSPRPCTSRRCWRIEDKLFPAMDALIGTFKRLENGKRGRREERTHPSAGRHAHQVLPGDQRLAQHAGKDQARSCNLALSGLKELALGGTAVGTGPELRRAGFAVEVAAARYPS